MNEQEFVENMSNLLADEATSEHFDVREAWDIEVRTFEEAGLMTANHGLVLSFPNGDEFQLQVLQSEQGAKEDEDEAEAGEEDDDPAAEAEAEFDRRAESNDMSEAELARRWQ